MIDALKSLLIKESTSSNRKLFNAAQQVSSMRILSDIKKYLIAKKNINIVFIGDSITSTEWVHPNWREIIEYVLKEELTKQIGHDNYKWKIPSWGIRCFNCGFDGSTTGDILKMLNERILSLKPTLAIWLINTNDVHFEKNISKYTSNVQDIIEKLSKQCKHVIIANRIPGNNSGYNKKYGEYTNTLKSLKLNKKTLYIDIYSSYSKYDLSKFYTFVSNGNDDLGIKTGAIDYVHPNQLGNAYIAKIILDKSFEIKFNPEKFMKENSQGKMFPRY